MGIGGRLVGRLKIGVATSQQDELHSLAQDKWHVLQNQIESLLPGHSTDKSEQEGVGRSRQIETPL